MAPESEKIRGPKYQSFVQRSEPSLIRTVSSSTPSQLGAIVIGAPVYEVFMELPECLKLNDVMVTLKLKQSQHLPAKALNWLRSIGRMKPENEPWLMSSFNMQVFLSRYPLKILSSKLFRPFVGIVRKFLISKLFEFTHTKRLYKAFPEFPLDNDLSEIVNALGPMDQLSEKYPHLARMKREMVHNIMDFTIKYCLDWIREVLLIQCDEMGKVQYYCPPSPKPYEGNIALDIKQDSKSTEENQLSMNHGKKKRKNELDKDNNRWETQTLTNSSSSTNSSNVDDLKDEFIAKRAKLELKELKEDEKTFKSNPPPSCSVTDVQSSQTENCSQPSSEYCPDSQTNPGLLSSDPPAFSFIRDDWSDMLNMALTDPNLAPHYKTMIHCLVASNRDMRNMIVVMRAQLS